MKPELVEIILIARCIKEENNFHNIPISKRLVSQCDRIEKLAESLDQPDYCKIALKYKTCEMFKESHKGCTVCEHYITPKSK
jgi:hypothetical protein